MMVVGRRLGSEDLIGMSTSEFAHRISWVLYDQQRMKRFEVRIICLAQVGNGNFGASLVSR